MYYVSDGDIYTYAIPDELRPFKMATVQGFVTDSVSGGAVPARIVVTDGATQTVWTTVENNPADGRFTVLLSVGGMYHLAGNEKSTAPPGRKSANRIISVAR